MSRDLLFTIVALLAGALSIVVGLVAAYLAWLTRRAVALGAESVALPLTRRRMDPPSVLVMVVFAVCFLGLGVALVAMALLR